MGTPLLDDSFVKCFAPIHIIQTFLGCSRINISNNLVSPTTPQQKLFTFVWIICCTFSFCYFGLHHYKQYYDKDTILFVTCSVGTLIQYISYLVNTIHVRFFQNTASIDMYVTIQRIDAILPLKQYKKLNFNQYYVNIFLMVLIIVPFEAGFTYYIVTIVEYPIFTIFCGMGLLCTYLEMLLTGSLIYYLTLRLKFLNNIVKYNLALKNHGIGDRPQPPENTDFIICAEGGRNLDLRNFLLSLTEILRSYKKIKEVFNFTIFNVVATVFVWALVVIEAMVESSREEFRQERTELIRLIVTGIWIVYYFILLTILASVSDLFIQETRQTKQYCLFVMSYRFEGPIRKGAKDILHAIQYTQPMFSVYDIFVLDKSLPLKLIVIITTNVVVLIQFTMYLD